MKGRKVKKPEWRRKYKTQIRTSSSVSCFLLSNRRIYVTGPTCRAVTRLCSRTCRHFARGRTSTRARTWLIEDKPSNRLYNYHLQSEKVASGNTTTDEKWKSDFQDNVPTVCGGATTTLTDNKSRKYRVKNPPVKSLKGCPCNWIVCLINRPLAQVTEKQKLWLDFNPKWWFSRRHLDVFCRGSG